MRIEVASSGVFVDVPNVSDGREARRIAAKLFDRTRIYLEKIPTEYRTRAARKFAAVYGRDPNEKVFQRVKNANAEVKQIALTVRKATEGWLMPVNVLYSSEQREYKARQFSVMARDVVERVGRECADIGTYEKRIFDTYTELKSLFAGIGLAVPPVLNGKKTPLDLLVESRESAILRCMCEKWVLKTMTRKARRIREQIAICFGNVGARLTKTINGTEKEVRTPYVSPAGLNEYKRSVQAGERFLDYFILKNEELGAEISMRDAAAAGQANPTNRRTELMIRANGLKAMAKRDGLTGYFLTMTAPRKYHKNAGSNYNGATPRDTHKYLQSVWVNTRAHWAKMGIRAHGVRVVEPHKDGCPHWHMLVFFGKGQADAALTLARNLFCAEDREELTNKRGVENLKPRFDAKLMKTGVDENGRELCPIAYIAKYISKNIDGKGLESAIDRETGEKITDGVDAVVAWSRIHGVRQFQFFGLESVTLWREIRRVSAKEQCDILRQFIEATGGKKGDEQKPDWLKFEELSTEYGAALITEKRRSEAYNDKTTVVRGVTISAREFMTRLGEWKKEYLTPAKRAALKASGSARPWTGENNCNQTNGSQNQQSGIGLILDAVGHQQRKKGATHEQTASDTQIEIVH